MADSVEKRSCPSCFAELAGDADLCVHCGYDLRLRAKRADVALARTQPVELRRQRSAQIGPRIRRAPKRKREQESSAAIRFDLFAGRWKYVLLGVPALVWAGFALGFLITNPRQPERILAALMLGGVAFAACVALRFFWILLVDIPRLLLRRKMELDETGAARARGLPFLIGGTALLVIGPVVVAAFAAGARGAQGFRQTQTVGQGILLGFLAVGFGGVLVCQGLGLLLFRSKALGVVVGIYLVLAFIVGVVVYSFVP